MEASYSQKTEGGKFSPLQSEDSAILQAASSSSTGAYGHVAAEEELHPEPAWCYDVKGEGNLLEEAEHFEEAAFGDDAEADGAALDDEYAVTDAVLRLRWWRDYNRVVGASVGQSRKLGGW